MGQSVGAERLELPLSLVKVRRFYGREVRMRLVHGRRLIETLSDIINSEAPGDNGFAVKDASLAFSLTRRSLLSSAILIPAAFGAQSLRAAGRTRGFESLGPSAARTVSTYESISIELIAPPPTTSARAGQSGGCRLRYRRSGLTAWQSGLDLPYDSGKRNGVQAFPAQYRGAALLLEPGTIYEISLIHDDGSEFSFSARTRIDVGRLAIARTVTLPDRSAPLTVTDGGSVSGYLVYEAASGKRATFDARRAGDYCLALDAGERPVRFVIFRNIRFTGALRHSVLLGSTERGNAEVVGDIIFDNCEFDDWSSPGSPGCVYAENLHSGIYSASTALENVTVQACHFHDPAFGANSWYPDEGVACTGTNHPEGPQCISFKKSVGGHVIRYNTFEAGRGVRFNDSMGETGNFSDAGFPAANCDIYGNIVRGVNDDGMEIEGRDQNIRIWNNLFDDCFHGIAMAPAYRGPIYVWGNVGLTSRSGRTRARGQNFLKWRRLSGTTDWSGAHVYIFNNTLLPPAEGSRGFKQLYGEASPEESIRNWHVWNNLVHNDQEPGRPEVAFEDPSGLNNDIRNNVFGLGWSTPNERTVPTGNVNARPRYAVYKWDPKRGVGTFILAPGPGSQGGIPVPGVFSERPDCGAHQHSHAQPVGYGHLNMPRGS